MTKYSKNLTILGIETSCDETSASLLRIAPSRQGATLKILSNVVASQVKIHRQYGGIVPEVAARAHMEKILPVIEQALKPLTTHNLPLPTYLAVTVGPGLITSLLVGVEAAKTLAYAWQKPLIPVNHLIGHIYANWLAPISVNPKYKIQNTFPAVCLVVSGGHTKLILMKGLENFREIGSTRDDAAGEAFDKVAKLLNLGYPGGPAIAQHAESILNLKSKILNLHLPRPMIDSNDFDFSFSGLKTAVLYTIKNKRFELTKQFVVHLCVEFQQAVIDVLISKTIRAARKYKAKSVLLAGGVAANKELRKQLGEKIKKEIPNTKYQIPNTSLCTDNAAMIAAAGYFKYIKTKEQLRKLFDWRKVKVNPNLEI